MTECWLNSGELPLQAGDPLLLRCILRIPSGLRRTPQCDAVVIVKSEFSQR